MKDAALPEILRSAGFRATRQRIAILKALAASHAPQSVDAIVARAGNVDRVTAYRTLESFKTASLARSVDLHQGRVLYELYDEHDHHHIVRTSCGVTEDFEGCGIDSVAQAALRGSKRFSSVTDHSFELFGTCKSCV